MSDCCTRVINIPGPEGPAGADGSGGEDGINAFTTIAAPSVAIPAALANATLTVGSTAWMVEQQVIYVEFAGYYQVITILSDTQVLIMNLDYDGNTAAGPGFVIGGRVGPGGLVGPDGALTGAAGGDLTGNYPNPQVGVVTTKGDLLVTTGGGVGHATRLAAGVNGETLHANSAIATGLEWAKINIASATQVTGVLPVANGGTAAITAAAARTSLSAASSGANGDITSLSALSTPLSIAQGGTAGATAAAARTSLDVFAREGLIISATAVNLNAALTDTLLTVVTSARYYITAIVIEAATISLTTATAGVFSAAGGIGTIAADQVLTALTASTKRLEMTLSGTGITDVFTGNLYFRVGTAQGAAATANVWVFGRSFA